MSFTHSHHVDTAPGYSKPLSPKLKKPFTFFLRHSNNHKFHCLISTRAHPEVHLISYRGCCKIKTQWLQCCTLLWQPICTPTSSSESCYLKGDTGVCWHKVQNKAADYSGWNNHWGVLVLSSSRSEVLQMLSGITPAEPACLLQNHPYKIQFLSLLTTFLQKRVSRWSKIIIHVLVKSHIAPTRHRLHQAFHLCSIWPFFCSM